MSRAKHPSQGAKKGDIYDMSEMALIESFHHVYVITEKGVHLQLQIHLRLFPDVHTIAVARVRRDEGLIPMRL